MKPVSYQSVPSLVNGGRPALEHVSTASNVMRCEKCGYASTDPGMFKKHMIEHTGTRFFCFYCNNVSFSEAELQTHLKQHTSKYPYKCPHCGQGYMRRLCFVKHIERLHGKVANFGPAKAGDKTISHVPVSSASPSVPTADSSALRPLVRVSVPTSSAPAFRLARDELRGKTLDTNPSNVSKGNGELFSPLNGLIQHNRALTVSLPEEVSIPAGCLVELVEVKTVNGTKELKLRLVSQQENGSVIKDARTTVSPNNTTMGKQLSSTLNNPNTVKPTNMGMCTVNRTQFETKTVNVERPAVVPVNNSKNVKNNFSKDKGLLKRTSQDIINLECCTPMPNKVPKGLDPVREGNCGIRVTQREPVKLNAPPPTIIANSTITANSCVTQRAMDEKKNSIPDPFKSILRRVSGIKSIYCDASVAVKLEPSEIHVKRNTASSSVPVPASGEVRTPSISLCKDDVVNPSFSIPRILNESSSFRTPVLSNCTNSKVSVWNQEVRPNDRGGEGDMPEPEGFPVISSVFSLSQQPEDVQGSIQPLVMALRGIVMDKSSNSVSTSRDQIKIINSTGQVKETATTKVCAMVAPKDGCLTHNLPSTERTSEPVKVEEHLNGIQQPTALTHNHTHVKEEKNSTSAKDENKCSADSKLSKDEEEPVSETAEHVDVSGTPDGPLQLMDKKENDVSSKFLTVSLKRVQVGVWKKSKKALKLRISKYKTRVPVGSLSDCTVIYPMPLKKDQLVKRPGPNQPVVVLNHPKPRTSVQGARRDTRADTEAPQVVPKCQILKMRLSKVMGQKYEVMGCTVGVFP